MIEGTFNCKGELIFEIGLIAPDETLLSVLARAGGLRPYSPTLQGAGS